MVWLFIFLPNYAAQMVGRLGGDVFDGFSQSSVVTSGAPSAPMVAAPNVTMQTAVASAVSAGPASSINPVGSSTNVSTAVNVSAASSSPAVTVSPKVAGSSSEKGVKKGSGVSQMTPEQLSKLRSQFRSNDHETR